MLRPHGLVGPWRQGVPTRLVIVASIAASLASMPALAAPPPHAGPAQVFANDAGSTTVGQATPSAAAIVDGHVIPLDQVVLLSLRDDRAYVIDQMIQDYVVDRECRRRGLKVGEAEIDAGVEKFRKAIAPATIADTLKEHHMTVAEMRYDFRQQAERNLIVEDQIKPPAKMAHCREIQIRYCGYGEDQTICKTTRTEAEALALMKSIQNQLKQGVDFGKLAAKYTEQDESHGKDGDIGVVYDGKLGVYPAVMAAALSLKKGEITQEPLQSQVTSAYFILQAVSTNANYAQSEKPLYQAAIDKSRQEQLLFKAPKYMVGLIDKSRLVFAPANDFVLGKPLPNVAATVDGHPILMKDVERQCLINVGRHAVDLLIQRYLIERDCQRRGIRVTDAEIDSRVDQLRRMIAPATIEDACKLHGMTLASLRLDYKDELERIKLVYDQVKPVEMAHCAAIVVKYCPLGTVPGVSTPIKHTQAQAEALIGQIQDQLAQGADFGDLAAQYSDVGYPRDRGDIGVLFPGMPGMDTYILDAGLALGAGQTSPKYFQTNDSYFIVRAISTSHTHLPDEDGLYDASLRAYSEIQARMMAQDYVTNLVKKAKITYFIDA